MQLNRRIMIVDDEVRNRKLLRLRFAKDYELCELEGGARVVEVALDQKPAVILLDIMMPDVDGLEVTRRLRACPELALVKIVLVTGKAMTEEKLAGYAAGADDYVTKPFDGEEMRAKVTALVRAHNDEAELKMLKESLEAEVQRRIDQLMRAERLALLGQNVGEIVHNLRNPLALIHSSLQMIETGQGDPSLARAYRATERMIDYINSFLNSYGAGARKTCERRADLAQVVDDEIQMILINSKDRFAIAVSNHVPKDLVVAIAPAYLHQVIGNLLKNAAEAMRACETRRLVISAGADGAGQVFIRIADTGPGIQTAHLGSVFDADFTTKTGENGSDKGTGLGLAFCKRVVTEAGGSIAAESHPGEGATFTVHLPVAA